jgi:putative two-component system response regulator
VSDVDLGGAIKQSHILVVDDIPANVKLISMLLAQDGYANVETVMDPRQVRAMVASRRYDLILLDIRMPHLDGHELIELLREDYGRDYLPVLVLTAQTDEATRKRALESGVRDFLTKPFEFWELLHRVRNMLEVRVLYRELERYSQQLEERVAERTHQLEATRLDVLRRLAIVGEFRDNDTGMHVRRMSHYSRHLARLAGLPEETCTMILDAAPLHDIGKIGIPDGILLKQGKLDPSEWSVMQQHVEIGGKMLSDSSFEMLDMARIIALGHHERWDGNGYPHRVKGADIPVVARIVTICDVFDALTSTRPYKPAWTIEAAVTFLRDNAGTQFDPDLVALFLQNLPAFLEIRERFHEPGSEVAPVEHLLA